MTVPSKLNDISIEISEDEKEFYVEGESFKTLVALDMLKYVSECKNTVVRKNVSIPSWLNEMAKNQNLNFSQSSLLSKDQNIPVKSVIYSVR